MAAINFFKYTFKMHHVTSLIALTAFDVKKFNRVTFIEILII